MKRSQKLEILQNELLTWYSVNGRKFQWRTKSMTSYQYIIAEILLQRTKAETIANFFDKFISIYPNWKSLNLVPLKSLEDSLKPIGLFRQRALRLKKLANEIVRLNEKIPQNRADLESIPFFGQYIINSILLFIHNLPAPLLDVNMSRVLERFFGKRKLADIRYDPYLQRLAFDFVNHKDSKKLNWAIIDFASIICKTKPRCSECPIVANCKYFRNQLTEK